MALSKLTALPQAPERNTDTANDFTNKADAFVNALVGFSTELNTFVEELNKLDLASIDQKFANWDAVKTHLATKAFKKGENIFIVNAKDGTLKDDRISTTTASLKWAQYRVIADIAAGTTLQQADIKNTSKFILLIEGEAVNVQAGGAVGEFKAIVDITDSLTLTNDDFGKLYTFDNLSKNINITLPAPSNANKNKFYVFKAYDLDDEIVTFKMEIGNSRVDDVTLKSDNWFFYLTSNGSIWKRL